MREESSKKRTPGADFDAVIILSHSNWFTEMRGNRYHYAKRFSDLVPVYFIQYFDPSSKEEFIQRVDDNLFVVNPLHGYTTKTLDQLLRKIMRDGVKKPLFWIYSVEYVHLLHSITIQFRSVYHATEAYLGSDMISDSDFKDSADYLVKLRKTMNSSSCVIAVSKGVADGILSDPEIAVPVHVVTNGCDFDFWDALGVNEHRKNLVIYQGGIHRKLDFNLIKFIVVDNPDIDFVFCGDEYVSGSTDTILWEEIKTYSNFRVLGKLQPKEVKLLTQEAKVGIIPFKDEDWLTVRSFPLKAFEYIAAGLEVVTTPIDSLNPFRRFFTIERQNYDFSEGIRKSLKAFPGDVEAKRAICRDQDYDAKFGEVLHIISQLTAPTRSIEKIKKNVLIIYSRAACAREDLRESLDSFGLFSRHMTTFWDSDSEEGPSEHFLMSFDAIILHQSLAIHLDLSDSVFTALKSYVGAKLMIIPGLDILNRTPGRIVTIDFDVLLISDNANKAGRNLAAEFGSAETVEISRGYFPLTKGNFTGRDFADRPMDVFYATSFYTIQSPGHMIEKQDCEIFDIFALGGIEISAAPKYLTQSKAIIGPWVKDGLDTHLSYGTVSPVMLQAIYRRIALILFEDTYTGVLEANVHYLVLKRDFSNIEELKILLNNNHRLEKVTTAAYHVVTQNSFFSQDQFIQKVVDPLIDKYVVVLRQPNLVPTINFNATNYRMIGPRSFAQLKTFRGYQPATTSSTYAEYIADTNKQLSNKSIKVNFSARHFVLRCFYSLPNGTRTALKTIVHKLRSGIFNSVYPK